MGTAGSRFAASSLLLGGPSITAQDAGSSSDHTLPLKDHSRLCPQWAAAGECAANPGYMLRSCMLSCSNQQSTPSHGQLFDVNWSTIKSPEPDTDAGTDARHEYQADDESVGEQAGCASQIDRSRIVRPRQATQAAVGRADEERQRRVRQSFLHAWAAYKRHAWGMDELEPMSHKGITSFGMGLTLVDSLDTLVLMRLDSEVAEAVQWVDASLHFGMQEEINVFEVTIRIVGGLLSAYEATGHSPLLHKAEEIGRRMLFAFHTPYGLPYGTIGLRSGKRYNPSWSRGASTVAEVASLQLEFRALSRHTVRCTCAARVWGKPLGGVILGCRRHATCTRAGEDGHACNAYRALGGRLLPRARSPS